METSKKLVTKLTGWGLTKPVEVNIIIPKSLKELKGTIKKAKSKSLIARGLGRSYGDAAQINSGSVIKLDFFKKIELDISNSTIKVGAGLSLNEILEYIIPRGYFIPVSPGTSKVTVGGAIAADIHGKNHHNDGSFSNFLINLTLIDGNGNEHQLSPDSSINSNKFWATVGGMGLTGIIVEATFKLLPIDNSFMSVDSKRYQDLESLMNAMEKADNDYKYSVAWVDSLHKNARGVLTLANHANKNELNKSQMSNPLTFKSKSLAKAPDYFPGGILNKYTVKAFNTAWFYKFPKDLKKEIQDISNYFHPLDGIKNWNKIYGEKGFLQYQFVVPNESKELITYSLDLLRKIGVPSFLTVLKRFGKGNKSPLSFPQKGWTLAIDIPNNVSNLEKTLSKLDHKIALAGGRIYLAKDSRQSPKIFKSTYPLFNEWLEIKRELDPEFKFVSDISNRLDFFEDL